MGMTLNGNGSIGGLSPGGLPDATVQQADLAQDVAGTGPAFSAYASNAQAITSGGYVLIQYNTLDPVLPSNRGWDTVNYKFKPGVAGVYHISAALFISGGIAAAQSLLTLYRNGAEYKRGADSAAAGTNILALSTDVYLGVNDEIAIYCFQGSGATKNTIAGTMYSWVCGHMVRAA